MPGVAASIPPTERDPTRTLLTIGGVIAALYFGRDIFVPIALAILLSFALAPAVRKLHALGLGRVFPVLLTTLFAFTIIFSLAGLVASQLRTVATELPSYEATMTRKVAALKGATTGGAFSKISAVFERLDKTINRSAPATPEAATDNDQAPAPRATTAPKEAPQPQLVQIQQPSPTPFETLWLYTGPLLHPLATAGISVIFVVFILLQREDLRNRLIRLFGASDLQRTTAAIDDGAKRLSRYLLTQVAINTSAGVVVGGAAWMFGVPNPILWGVIFGCMRFVPYVGPVIGGALPIGFAAAVSTGWSTAIGMAAVILVAEAAYGQVIEPLLYGHNTGLSPVAVVLSATFWTALWGPIGLLLAVPLTVCVVVIGRHVEQLEFLDVLLGDRPPLTAPETFYQRMLANDPAEVSDRAEECLRSMALADYYDDVVLPGLLLAQADVASERLAVDRQIQIRDATADVIEDLGDDHEERPTGRWSLFRRDAPDSAAEKAEIEHPDIAPRWKAEGTILCIGARGPLDDCPAQMVAQLLEKRGLGARAESYASLSKAEVGKLDVSHARLICLSCLDGSSPAYLRFALRRIKRRAPRARILIGAWWLQNEADAPSVAGAQGDDAPLSDPVATTIVDAVRYGLAFASALPEDELTSELKAAAAEDAGVDGEAESPAEATH